MKKIKFRTSRGILTLEKKENNLIIFNESEELTDKQAVECLWRCLELLNHKEEEEEDRSEELRELGLCADLQATAAIAANYDLKEEEIKEIVKNKVKSWQRRSRH